MVSVPELGKDYFYDIDLRYHSIPKIEIGKTFFVGKQRFGVVTKRITDNIFETNASRFEFEII